MWTIDKQFSCCYGHRVYVQKLNAEYTGSDCQAKCRHLHGHEGLIHVFLESETLNEQSMVTDFKHLGWLKNFIDDTLDHKFVIDFNDPMFKQLVMDVSHPSAKTELTVEQFLNGFTTPVYVPGTNYAVGRTVSRAGHSINTSQFEILEGYLIVPFVPTSENLAKWMFEIVDSKMSKLGVKTTRIDWFETPKSRSSYYGN